MKGCPGGSLEEELSSLHCEGNEGGGADVASVMQIEAGWVQDYERASL